jgi:hypothetical protein
MAATRTLIDTNQLEWIDTGVGGGQIKLLRMNEDYSYIDLYRAPGNSIGPAHVHLGPTEVLFLSGEVETAAGRAGRGYWVLEPAGAMHRATQIYVGGVVFNHTHGPMAFIGKDGTVPPLIFGQSLKATLNGNSRRLSGQQLTQALYPEDYDSGIVNINELSWIDSGYPGIRFKILRVFDNGHYTIRVKGEHGSVVPTRRYTAPTDYYVLSGCLSFKDAEAGPDHWAYEPTGAIEGPMKHVGETTYLATCTGAMLDLADDRHTVQRVIDGLCGGSNRSTSQCRDTSPARSSRGPV